VTHLLDTNVVISAFHAGLDLPADAVTHVCVVTHVELSYGIAAARGPVQTAQRAAQLQQFLSTWQPVPLTPAVAASFVEVAGAALAAGQNPGKRMNDLLIAATARSRGWTLVTEDRTLATAVQSVVPTMSLR
jgi:toxin FitB